MAGNTKMEDKSTAPSERLNALQQIVSIHIDGDWDVEMIKTAFDQLEKRVLHLDGEDVEAKGRGRIRRYGRSGRKNRRVK